MIDGHEAHDSELQVFQLRAGGPDRRVGHEANALPALAAGNGKLERLSLVAGGGDPDGGALFGWCGVGKHLDDGRHLPDLHALPRRQAGAGGERRRWVITSTTATSSCQTVPDWFIVR